MKRLPKEAVEFIRYEDKSYRKIISDVYQKFGLKIGKSLVSYYKRSKCRVKMIDLSKLPSWKLEWLFGLYYADGCKFIDRGTYVIKFYLDSKRDGDITKRTFRILKILGLSPIIFVERGKSVIRVYSKELYKFLPAKSEVYKPKDIFAFLSGMIDGDGGVSKEGRRRPVVYIAQDYHKDLMSFLIQSLPLSKHEHKRKGIFFGKRRERVAIIYYVPADLCQALIQKNYCIKLLRYIN